MQNLQEISIPNLPHRRDHKFLGVGVLKDKKYKNIRMKFNWNLQRERGFKEISLPWGRYGYAMELYNTTEKI